MEERQITLQLSDEEYGSLAVCVVTLLKAEAVDVPGELNVEVKPDPDVLLTLLRKLRDAGKATGADNATPRPDAY